MPYIKHLCIQSIRSISAEECKKFIQYVTTEAGKTNVGFRQCFNNTGDFVMINLPLTLKLISGVSVSTL